MQGLILRRQLHQKQKEMLNLVVEQQQKQLQYLEMLKLQHLQQKARIPDISYHPDDKCFLMQASAIRHEYIRKHE